MKKQLLLIGSLFAMNAFGQGFPFSSVNWNLPDGGKITGGTSYGFDSFYGYAFTTDNTGSQHWNLVDMVR
jgi:hypothetical protein